jgi:hypothetical protein
VIGRPALAALVFAVAVRAACAAEPTAADRREIEHLLSYLEGSGCQFFRNGSWYPAGEARKHLQRKYDYLLRKAMISTAESFVALGATGSSTSGKPYQVRCAGDAAPTPSAAWLSAELERYRKAGK